MNKLTRMCASMRTVTALMVFGLAAGPICAWPLNTAHITGIWDATPDENSIHFLNNNLNDLGGSFSAGATRPNGLATDGSMIWSGHATTHELIAYDTGGIEIGRWSLDDPDAGDFVRHIQGLEYVPRHPVLGVAVLALANGDEIRLYDPHALDDPDTGGLLDIIPSVGISVEGLAWDGEFLWQLSLMEIFKTDISDGSIVGSIPNPALPAGHFGKGLAVNAPGQLTVVCDAGRWWQVDAATGEVLIEGSNGQDMYGFTSVTESSAVPEPLAMAVLVFVGPILLGRKRRRR